MGLKYEIVKKLHENEENNSYVSIIKEKNTEKYYVVKVIRGIKNTLSKIIFEREITALKRLNQCDNIVKLINNDTISQNKKTGERAGRIFLEYAGDKNLMQLDLRKTLNKEKYKIAKQLITAIKAAHKNNIIHRDIKPENVMILDEYNGYKVKLIDFGISKIKGMISEGTVYRLATNRYSAPEVCYHSENATEKSDIYSLGATIYYVFTEQQPPIPAQFEQVIKNLRGINPDLKTMINKMTKYSPDDRYNNIIEIEREFDIFFYNFLKNNASYLFYVDTETVLSLKRKHYISYDKKINEIINYDLPNFFNDTYGFLEDGEKNLFQNTNCTTYKFSGKDIFMECIYNSDKQLFEVSEFKKLSPDFREKWQKSHYRLEGRVHFLSFTNNAYCNMENNNFELTHILYEHKKKYIELGNKNKEFWSYFNVWETFLDISIKDIKEHALKFKYKSFKRENNSNNILFCLDNNFNIKIDDLDFNKETNFIYDSTLTEENSKNKTVNVGYFEEFFIEGQDIYVKIKSNSISKLNIPKKNGCLVENYNRKIGALKKQIWAIKDFYYDNFVCNENLKNILFGIESPTLFKRLRKINYFNKFLDKAQKSAIQKALNSQSICLIQGPPGTGKTFVITEIILQILKRNFNRYAPEKNKILLVSQAHVAVDNVLEGLNEKIAQQVKIVRIGNEDNLTEKVKENYGVRKAKENWVNSVIKESNKYAQGLLKKYGFEISDFNKYLELENYSKIHDKDMHNDTVERFRNLINCDNNFKQIIEIVKIQHEWVNKIKSVEDSENTYVSNAFLVAGTCVGFNSNNIVNNMFFDYVIIDEAAKATPPELLISLLKGIKIIMVGDHKQLPPIIDKDLIKKSRNIIKEKQLKYGLFMKLFESLPETNKAKLAMQYRMHPVIGNMISEIYYDNEIDNGVSRDDRSNKLKSYSNCVIRWISTSQCDIKQRKECSTIGNSYENQLEVKIIKEQLKIMDNEVGKENYTIGIITGYRAQKSLIEREVKRMDLNNIDKNIEINTVDAFQGRQKDIIIYSIVRSSKEHSNIGFQKEKERTNVAFSRAKRLIIIIGDHQFVNNRNIKDNKFPEIIDYINNNNFCEIIQYGG